MGDETFQYITLMANHISRMKTYPYLDGTHYVVMCLLFREGDNENSFSRKNIFGSWFLNILMCFSGSVVSNFLAGEPIITPFKYPENLVLASVIWYLINFCPKDLAYQFFKIPTIEILLTCTWNIYLVNKIQSGISYGIKHFPDAFIIATVLGTAKGCGDRYMIAIVNVIKGISNESDNVFLCVPEQTKCSFVCSIFFVLSHYYQLPGYNQPFVFTACLLLFMHTSISHMAFGSSSIFSPLEHLVCAVLFSWGPSETIPIIHLNPEPDDARTVLPSTSLSSVQEYKLQDNS